MKTHNIFTLFIFLICPLSISTFIGCEYYNTNKERVENVYRDYGHDARLGKYIDINDEKLKITNHNFWASTYTLSNGVEVDDNYVDDRVKIGYTYTYTNHKYPMLESFLMSCFTLFCYYVLILYALQEIKKSKKRWET